MQSNESQTMVADRTSERAIASGPGCDPGAGGVGGYATKLIISARGLIKHPHLYDKPVNGLDDGIGRMVQEVAGAPLASDRQIFRPCVASRTSHGYVTFPLEGQRPIVAEKLSRVP